MIRLTKEAERRVREWAAMEEECSREEGAADWAMFVRAYDQLAEENERLRKLVALYPNVTIEIER